MECERRSLYETVMSKAGSAIREYKVPLAATWIVGLLAHMFMFTNKLLNHDEIVFLFGKGATLESGRWMLAATELIFPNVSMPWIYGVIALAITSLAVCLIIRLLDIRSKVLQALLAGLIVSFPAQTSIFCFMFTSAPYALALLGSVLSVYIYIYQGQPEEPLGRQRCTCAYPRYISGVYRGGVQSLYHTDDTGAAEG